MSLYDTQQKPPYMVFIRVVGSLKVERCPCTPETPSNVKPATSSSNNNVLEPEENTAFLHDFKAVFGHMTRNVRL